MLQEDAQALARNLTDLCKDYREIESISFKWTIRPADGIATLLCIVALKHDIEFNKRLMLACSDITEVSEMGDLNPSQRYLGLIVEPTNNEFGDRNVYGFHVYDSENYFFSMSCLAINYMEYQV